MTRIIIEALPPDQMRLDAYKEEGCGDWFRDVDGDVHIQVASTADIWENEATFLVGLHEMVEARLCHQARVTEAEVDAFDAAFTGEDQPGDHPDAPYQRQHRSAMVIEHMMAIFLNIWNWGTVE